MPRMSPEFQAEFLREPHVAVLATLRGSGAPYTVPVWFLYEDSSFWITGTYDRVWCKQLFRDPRASLCIEAMGAGAGHVGADGTVRLHEHPGVDIWTKSRQLVDKYVPEAGRDPFFANMQTEHRLLFELVPDTLRAIDMRVYRGKRADREYQAARVADEQ